MKTITKRSIAKRAKVIKFSETWASKQAVKNANLCELIKAAGETNPAILGYLGDGSPVFTVDGSHCHAQAKPYIRQALAAMSNSADFLIKRVVKFSLPIGRTHCVPVDPLQDKFTAQVRMHGPADDRKPRNWKSRIVLGRKSEPCNGLAVILGKIADTNIRVLFTTYVADTIAPKEIPDAVFALSKCPADRKEAMKAELEESKVFWVANALTEDALND
jgi:hypothetical protein